MEVYHWTSTNSGLLFLGISLPSLLSIPMARYCKTWKRRRTVAVELILAMIPLFTLRVCETPFPGHQICFIALVVCVGLFMTTSQAQVMAEVSDAVQHIETKRKIDSQKKSGMGTGYAFCNVAIALGQFLGPLVAGYAKVGLGWGGMTLILAGTSGIVGISSLLVNS